MITPKTKRFQLLFQNSQYYIEKYNDGIPIPERVQLQNCNLNDFEEVGYLGKGSFGEVLKVNCKLNGQIYALKMMEKSVIEQRERIKQVKQELEIMYALNHPNIIKLLGHFEDAEKLYMVQEIAFGGDLNSVIEKEKKIEEKLCAKYLAQIVNALLYLKNFRVGNEWLKILHRDLKLENITVDRMGNVKIIDFGESNFLGGDQIRQTVIGTLAIRAPEIIKNEAYDERVDVFSLGVVLSEMLTGKNPFYKQKDEEIGVEEITRRILYKEPFFPEDISYLGKSLIKKMLEKDPNKRISLEEIKEHDFLHQEFDSLDLEEEEENEQEIQQFREKRMQEILEKIKKAKEYKGEAQNQEELSQAQIEQNAKFVKLRIEEIKDLDKEIMEMEAQLYLVEQENSYIQENIMQMQQEHAKNEDENAITFEKIQKQQKELQKLEEVFAMLEGKLERKNLKIWENERRLDKGRKIIRKREQRKQKLNSLNEQIKLLAIEFEKLEQQYQHEFDLNQQYKSNFKFSHISGNNSYLKSSIQSAEEDEKDKEKERSDSQKNSSQFSNGTYNSRTQQVQQQIFEENPGFMTNLNEENLEASEVCEEFLEGIRTLNSEIKTIQDLQESYIQQIKSRQAKYKKRKYQANQLDVANYNRIIYGQKLQDTKQQKLRKLEKLKKEKQKEYESKQLELQFQKKEFLEKQEFQIKNQGVLNNIGLVERSVQELKEIYNLQLQNMKKIEQAISDHEQKLGFKN
ncbi:Protein kinase-like domain [Pseudocohnilembus persalinus]|uniref:Protein kinase-like domain n=1 Tax=Pseudocohnilembus persalinus TaxID=266149 RepID=A0A0V0Q939_PSEPJ|nr:Protein kinase-like domain [Pseudocohnilembus persalinus]|eukprot:KRW98548.1 Protein kinase-like domain [Pseudocohnilembus persalinus]